MRLDAAFPPRRHSPYYYMNENDQRTGARLLIAGSVAGIITMVLHPVGPHGGALPSPHALETLTRLNRIIHGLALTALPMMFLGAMALTRRLAARGGRLPLAALVVYGFALVAIMSAGCLSGFVGSDILGRMVEGDPKLESRRMMLDYTFRLNQAYSSVYVVGTCVAIFLWSVEIVRIRLFSRGLGIYGWVLGSVIAAALFGGFLPLDVHGFGLVVLVQAVWFIVAGTQLRHPDENTTHQPIMI